MAVKVCLVEDDEAIREMMTDLVRRSEHCTVLGSYATAEELMKHSGTMPDVVLTDLQLPGRSGVDMIREMKVRFPEMQFLVCTIFEDNERIYDALIAGATGYLLKSSDAGNIVENILSVYKGESPMSGTIARKVIENLYHRKKNTQYSDLLTERERGILEYLSRGYRYKEIAAESNISVETVRTHIRNIYEKLQVNSRTAALNRVYGN